MSDTAKDQAIAQCESIASMIAALDVDYQRLEDLRSEKKYYVRSIDGPTEDDTPENWTIDNPEDAEELAELEAAAGDCESEDEARQRIEDDPLSVEVRSDWVTPGEDMTAGEFRIVLCTGGPHVELVGDLDDYKQPSRVRVIYKDWGDRGELYDFDRDSVLRYCRCLYFGE